MVLRCRTTPIFAAAAALILSACQTIAHPVGSPVFVSERTKIYSDRGVFATRPFRDRYGRVLFPTSDGRVFTNDRSRSEYLYSLSRRAKAHDDYGRHRKRDHSHKGHRSGHHDHGKYKHHSGKKHARHDGHHGYRKVPHKAKDSRYGSHRAYTDLKRAEDHVRILQHKRNEAFADYKRKRARYDGAHREKERLDIAQYELFDAERRLARLKDTPFYKAEPKGYRYYKDHGRPKDSRRHDRRYDGGHDRDRTRRTNSDRDRRTRDEQQRVERSRGQANQRTSRNQGQQDRSQRNRSQRSHDDYRRRYQGLRENNQKFRERLADAREKSRQTGRPVDDYLRDGLRRQASDQGK